MDLDVARGDHALSGDCTSSRRRRVHVPARGLTLVNLSRARCFLFQPRQRLGRIARRDQHFEKLFGYGIDSGRVDFAVEGDDAAECRSRIRCEGLPIGIECLIRDRHTAGIGVLDDDARSTGKSLGAFPRRVRIGDIVKESSYLSCCNSQEWPGRFEVAKNAA